MKILRLQDRIIFLIMILFLSSCTHRPYAQIKIIPDYNSYKINKVGIIPFKYINRNYDDYSLGVTEYFKTQLANSTNYYVFNDLIDEHIPLIDITKMQLTKSFLEELGSKYKIDAVIIGEVFQYIKSNAEYENDKRQSKHQLYSSDRHQVKIKALMIEVATGTTLWENYYSLSWYDDNSPKQTTNSCVDLMLDRMLNPSYGDEYSEFERGVNRMIEAIPK